MGIGPVEMLIVGGMLFGACLIPIGTLVLAFLIYDRVKRIEQRLDQR